MIKAINDEGLEVEFIYTNFCMNKNLTKITELPTNLKKLHCFRNKLISLPSELPSTLTLLSCWGNQLTSLPDLPSNLKYLFCANNKLIKLPDLTLYKNLKHVHCDLKNFEPYMLDLSINFLFY